MGILERNSARLVRGLSALLAAAFVLPGCHKAVDNFTGFNIELASASTTTIILPGGQSEGDFDPGTAINNISGTVVIHKLNAQGASDTSAASVIKTVSLSKGQAEHVGLPAGWYELVASSNDRNCDSPAVQLTTGAKQMKLFCTT